MDNINRIRKPDSKQYKQSQEQKRAAQERKRAALEKSHHTWLHEQDKIAEPSQTSTELAHTDHFTNRATPSNPFLPPSQEPYNISQQSFSPDQASLSSPYLSSDNSSTPHDPFAHPTPFPF